MTQTLCALSDGSLRPTSYTTQSLPTTTKRLSVSTSHLSSYLRSFLQTLIGCEKDPFSFGIRDCLGKNLAYSELRVAIARLLFRFDYELAPGQEDWMDKSRVLVVWEKGPLKVKLTERDLLPVE